MTRPQKEEHSVILTAHRKPFYNREKRKQFPSLAFALRFPFVFAAVALLAFAIGGCAPVVVGPTPTYASIDVRCGDRTYTVSTGNNRGDCKAADNLSAACDDGSGNKAEVGRGSGCTLSAGSGSCTIKQQ